MKALVTGGAGFIGSTIVRLLLDKSWEVRVVDNLSSGHMFNIEGLPISFIEGDIRDASIAEQACEGVDVIFHLAASVGRQRSIDDPINDSSINLLGTIQILEAMRKKGVKRIVYSSSAAIYGELMTNPIDENHPQNADTPYGISKLAAEKMILSYADIYDIDVVCLRYFNIYGINQFYDAYGNVMPIFAKRIFDHQPITIYGDGEQTRDFLNVEDIAKANYLAATSKIHKACMNLGSGMTITINELADYMIKCAGINVQIIHAPERKGDVRHCRADATKALELLNFKPTVDLYEGVKRYVEWYQAQCK